MAREDGRVMTPRPLTGRQDKVLTFLRDYTTQRGYPPSMREIGEAVGLTSTSSVAYVLRRLVDAGHIRKVPGGNRAITVAPDAAPSLVSLEREDLRRLITMALAVTRDDDEFLNGLLPLLRPTGERAGWVVTPPGGGER